MLAAGRFVTDKTTTEQTGTGHMLQLNIWLGFDVSVAFLPFEIFILVGSFVGVFKEEKNMIGGETPGITVVNWAGLLVIVDVTGTKGIFQASILKKITKWFLRNLVSGINRRTFDCCKLHDGSSLKQKHFGLT